LPGGTEKNHEDHSQDSLSPGRGLNPGPHECEGRVLTTGPRRSIRSVILNLHSPIPLHGLVQLLLLAKSTNVNLTTV
jgi:hypothetical protein